MAPSGWCWRATAAKTRTVEDVVPQHQRHLVITDEVRTNDERLGQPVGLWLLGVLILAPDVRTVTQQALKPGKSVGVLMINTSRMP